MRVEVTRNVVSDLWPLCQSGEASSDSQAVVNQFLIQDPDFAAVLKEGESLRRVMPPVRLSADAELKLLMEAQKRARWKLLIVGGGVVLGAMALFASLWVVVLVFTRAAAR